MHFYSVNAGVCVCVCTWQGDQSEEGEYTICPARSQAAEISEKHFASEDFLLPFTSAFAAPFTAVTAEMGAGKEM